MSDLKPVFKIDELVYVPFYEQHGHIVKITSTMSDGKLNRPVYTVKLSTGEIVMSLTESDIEKVAENIFKNFKAFNDTGGQDEGFCQDDENGTIVPDPDEFNPVFNPRIPERPFLKPDKKGFDVDQLEESFNDAVRKAVSFRDIQVGGSHYKNFVIQPIDFISKNNLNFSQGSIIKYVCRYNFKNGIEDLKKAKHYIDMLIEDLESEQ